MAETNEETRPLRKIEAWLKEIKNKEIREKALKNAGDCDTLEDNTTSITNALYKAFSFNDSTEGFDYWAEALEKVRKQR